MTRKKLYKVLGGSDEPINGGHGKWSLPDENPGEWMPAIEGSIVPCKNGYHLCERKDILSWVGSDDVTVYEAEGRGNRADEKDKVAFREARLLHRIGHLNARALRHFAADCAERVLPIFEKARPGDDRPRKAIQAARDYAEGRIPPAALAAAGDAARAAAEAAARAAAETAAGAAAEAAAGDAAGAAAWAAARAAAWAAARAAAETATRDAERQWQARRLWRYLEASR